MQSKVKFRVGKTHHYIHFESSFDRGAFEKAPDRLVEGLIKKLRSKGIHSAFIVAPGAGADPLCARVRDAFREKGFPAECLELKDFTIDRYAEVKAACAMVRAEAKRHGCIILSLSERRLLDVFGASLLAYLRSSPDGFTYRVETHKAMGEVKGRDLEFVHGFLRYLEMDSWLQELDEAGAAPVEAPDGIERGRKAPGPPEPAHGKLFPGLAPGTAVAGSRRFPIRSKLIAIISMVIVVSLSVMIFLATYFFKVDSTVRVQENNLRLSEIIAQKMTADFSAIIEKSNLLAGAMLRGGGQKDVLADLLFTTERDFIFVGVAERPGGGGRLRFESAMYNLPWMDKHGVSRDVIDRATDAAGKSFARSFNSEVMMENASASFRRPVLGISMPLMKGGGVQAVIVAYISMEKVLRSFRTSDITTMFMVNGGGDVIAHSDSRRVLAAAGYANLPIVRLMFKSKVDNGQTRYSDEKGRYHLGSFKKIGVAGAGVIATVSEDTALAAVYGIQRRNIYLMVIVLNVAVLIVYYFARTLSAPILSLVSAAQTIRDGDFNLAIRPTTRDEIGELTEAFVEMGRGLQEREKIKEAFGKFVHREIAEMAMRDEIKLGGMRKDAAIMFADIRDFTALAEKMQPEEIVGFLNGYLTRMVECVNNTHGVVDKFIGDAVMAVYGAPVSTGNDAENAVNGALLMRRVLRDFNRTRGRPGRPKIQIGMGINAGTVVAGQIGSQNRMEYTVIGDAVNLASRIEALNKPFGTDILISEDAHRKVPGIFDVVGMQKITVKGKEKHQQVYTVLGRLDDATRPKSLEELRSLLGTKAKGDAVDVISFDEEKYEILAR